MREPLPSIRDAWQSYREHVLPPDAPSVQVQECRRAFYAGAHSVLCVVTAIGDDSVSEDQGLDTLTALHEENDRFLADVKAGRL